MKNNSAQGSITIHRLRSGDSVFISLDLQNGIALQQAVDPVSGEVGPDWTIEKNQPIIKPVVKSARNNPISIDAFRWDYNGVELDFPVQNSVAGWTTDSTGKFKMNDTDGSLRIIQNLASKVNIANDTLLFTCRVTNAGNESIISKGIDIYIQPVGASSYIGSLVASPLQIDDNNPTCTLTTHLQLNIDPVEDYTVKWYKDNQLMTDKTGKEITVGRGDIDGMQLFIAEFYIPDTEESVARAGVYVYDRDDEFIVVLAITSVNKEVDEGKPVTVQAKVVRMKNQSEVITPSNPSWYMGIYRRDNWEELGHSETDTIEVSTTHTDYDNNLNDVEVVAEVTWSANV